MPKKVRPIPKGYHAVTPSLNQLDAAQTIGFCKKAFGAKLRMMMKSPTGGVMHAEIEVGDSVIMLSDATGQPAVPAGLFLYVDNVDKVFAKAVKAGAEVVMPVRDMFWGDRFGSVRDPQGNTWAIATHREDVPPKEMKKRAAAVFAPSAGG
jgi:PhnB protein